MQLSNDQASFKLLIGLVATVILMLCGMWFTGLAIDWASLDVLVPVVALQLGLIFYCRYRKLHRFQPVIETMLLLTAATFVILPITYVSARIGMPLTDAYLAEIDDALQVNWPAMVEFVDQHPTLAVALQLAYLSFRFQLVFLPLYFALFSTRGQAIVFGYLAIAVVSSVVSVWFPAYGTYVTYGVGQSDLNAIVLNAAYSFIAEFDAVRSDPDFVMSLDRVEGILTFPSVHAGVALLCVWGAAGSRLLFWPLLVLNVAMAFAAITHGSHYVVDVVAGLVVAAVCIAAAARIFPGNSIRAAHHAERQLYADIRSLIPRRRPTVAAEIDHA